MYINDILRLMNTEKKEVVTFRCKPVVLEYLKEVAEENHISLSSVVDNIVTEFYEKKEELT